MHVYCYFLLLTSKENWFGPPLFLGWRCHWSRSQIISQNVINYHTFLIVLQFTLIILIVD